MAAAARSSFELIYWTLRLLIYYPQIGLPLLAIVIVAARSCRRTSQHQNKDWDSGPPVELHRAVDAGSAASSIPTSRQVVFEDFAFRLFSTAHARAQRRRQARRRRRRPTSPSTARTSLAQREPPGAPVEQVVVGALRVVR